MPAMTDPRFEGTVIYVCAHSAEGAMGLVINRVAADLSLPDLLDQLGLPETEAARSIRIHFGGPVETSRGFVLHSTDYLGEGSMMINRHTAITATIDVLEDIATGAGPDRSLLALGYAGWSAGQLDGELKQNAWLTVPADASLLFDGPASEKWTTAVRRLGIDPAMLQSGAGNA